MDRGVDGLVRETFYSSLKLAEDALLALGISPEEELVYRYLVTRSSSTIA